MDPVRDAQCSINDLSNDITKFANYLAEHANFVDQDLDKTFLVEVVPQVKHAMEVTRIAIQYLHRAAESMLLADEEIDSATKSGWYSANVPYFQ